jgi:hypothetical protein
MALLRGKYFIKAGFGWFLIVLKINICAYKPLSLIIKMKQINKICQKTGVECSKYMAVFFRDTQLIKAKKKP